MLSQPLEHESLLSERTSSRPPGGVTVSSAAGVSQSAVMGHVATGHVADASTLGSLPVSTGAESNGADSNGADSGIAGRDMFLEGGYRHIASNMISLAIRDLLRDHAGATAVVRRHAERARDWLNGVPPGALSFEACCDGIGIHEWADGLRHFIFENPREASEVFRNYERCYVLAPTDYALAPTEDDPFTETVLSSGDEIVWQLVAPLVIQAERAPVSAPGTRDPAQSGFPYAPSLHLTSLGNLPNLTIGASGQAPAAPSDEWTADEEEQVWPSMRAH